MLHEWGFRVFDVDFEGGLEASLNVSEGAARAFLSSGGARLASLSVTRLGLILLEDLPLLLERQLGGIPVVSWFR